MALMEYNRSSEQVIDFSEPNADYSECVTASKVTVISGPSENASCSSKVKLNNVVDYTWEERFYAGQLLAVHVDGKYIAYGIKAMGKSHSLVRIVNLVTSCRALIRGLSGMMQDIAFSYISSPITLACVDVRGMVFVYSIVEKGSDVVCQLRFQIQPISDNEIEIPHRVFWCPYIPDELSNEDYDDKMSQLLAVTRFNKIELWSIEVVTKDFGCGPVSGTDVTRGRILIDAHKGLIVDATFSPDGTAIATASMDGDCKFYQVYMHTKGEPRCLHHWQPHGGKSVTSLFFLDDHKNANPEAQFWKFAITGAENNSELKLWSCESWECLQTIHIEAKDGGSIMLKACIDPSSSFILLSDMFHRALYILQIQKEQEDKLPCIKSINVFKLSYPILSFNIVDAGVTLLKPSGLDEPCNGDGGDDNHGLMVRMYLVQPKSLQECHIVFKPPQASSHPNSFSTSIINNNTSNLTSFDDNLPEVEAATTSTPFSSAQLNLMTPDDFHASNNNVEPAIESSPVNTVMSPIVTENISPRFVNPAEADPAVVQVGFASGGSSPSREVEEILSIPAYYIENNENLVKVSQAIPMPPPPPVPVITTSIVPNPVNNDVSSEKMKSLEASVLNLHSEIANLTLLLKQQNSEIQTLRKDVQERDSHQMQQTLSALSSWWTDNRSQIVRNVVTPLEQIINPGQLSKKICSNIESTVNEKVTAVISKEIDRSIHTAMEEPSKQLKETLTSEINQRMAQENSCLAQTIEKCILNKNFSDTLVANVVSSCGPTVEQSYKETMTKVVIPMFERASNTMFNQMNDAFSKDVREIELFSSKWNEKASIEIESIKSATDHLTLTAQQFSVAVDKVSKKIEEAFTELQKGFQLQTGAVVGSGSMINNGNIRSRTVTPAPLDPNVAKAHLLSLIKSAQYNSAFKQALSASDLELVRFVCEKVNPQQVFTPSGCLIQQPILLSLIQQLSADMANYSETNHKYLEEAVMNLDTSSASQGYIPSVLGALQKQLQNYIELNPKGSLAKRANLLLMATRSLLS